MQILGAAQVSHAAENAQRLRRRVSLFGALQSTYNKEDPCPSWIFLCVPEDISDARDKKQWIQEYLDSLDWNTVSNAKNKRFICPKCAKEKV